MQVRRGSWLVACAVAWLTAACGSTFAQQVGVRELPSFSASHEIEVPKGETAVSFAFSPDHSEGYLLVYKANAIDIWRMVVSYWPEVLGAVVALIAVIWLFCFIRVRSRPRIPGDPYCRRCNYHLIQQAKQSNDSGAGFLVAEGARCPECGCDLQKRPPLRGRSAARRLAPLTLPAAAALAGYLALFAFGVGRQNAAAYWLCLDSSWVDRWAAAHGSPWLLKWNFPFSEIRRINVKDGRVHGTAYRTRSLLSPQMLVAPDGKSLFAYDELGRFLRMSTATGRILGSLGVREILAGGGAGEDSLIGVSSDSRVAYLAVDIQGRASRIVEWNFVDGNHTAVIDEEKFVSHRYFRRYITNAGVSRIVSIPGGPHPPPRCRVRVVELPNGVSRELDMPIWESDPDQEGMNISETPCLAPDGRTLYGNGSTDGVVGFDLETGQSLGHAMAQPWRRDRSCAPVISSDGRMLFAGVYDRHVWVRNTAAKEWIARLEVGDQISHLVVSQDDVWIAALGYFAGSPKLLLFDLTPLRALLDKRTP